MNSKDFSTRIIDPMDQLYLYGFKSLFKSFVDLYKKKNLPSVILLSGPKGSGKCTFANHFINFLLSDGEKHSYSVDNNEIFSDNKSFKLISSNIHPNFFSLSAKNEMYIKVEKIRSLLKFLTKSTYTKELKIVLIDDAENLNTSSNNALLKSLEEPDHKTFFFIIQDNSRKISETIKSRCLEFRIFHDFKEKKEILNKLFDQYNQKFDFTTINERFYFDTPGNILKYFLLLDFKKVNLPADYISFINFLFEEWKIKKELQFLNFATFFIEMFYSDLILKNKSKLSKLFANKTKIMKLIIDMKKFNLDKTNSFIVINKILHNEK